MINLKLVLRTYSALRQMSPDDIALLETLRGLNDGDRELMVETLQGKATAKKAGKKSSTSKPREYDHCLRCGTTKRDSSHRDKASPDYHEFQSSKEIDFCARCKGASEIHPVHHDAALGGYHPFESSKSSQSSSKSPRASGMAARLKERRSEQRDKTTTITDDEHCMYELSYGPCLQAADANIHHLRNHPNHHGFTVGEFTAPPAPAPSPANGGASGSIANSGVETENVSTATGG